MSSHHKTYKKLRLHCKKLRKKCCGGKFNQCVSVVAFECHNAVKLLILNVEKFYDGKNIFAHRNLQPTRGESF
jgi:hypothetical protein